MLETIKNALTNPVNPRKINITVFGPRGVGKTSLLTAMYDQFEATTYGTSLMLIPDIATSMIMQDKKAQLTRCFENSQELEVAEGIAGTSEPQDFEYEFTKTGMAKCVKLYFKDFPGGSLESDIELVKKLLDESMAVLIAIDAVALMEENGKWHQEINKPTLVTSYFQKAYNNINSPRLVIFAPVKCEKYMRMGNNDLIERVEASYKTLIQFFAKPEINSQVVVVVTPIQTLGNVEFSRIKVQNINNSSYPIFYFRKCNPPLYSPVDCEQPLRYLLRFLINFHLQDRFFVWQAIRKLLGGLLEDKAFKDAAIKFANDCKTTGNFSVLQDVKGWLETKR